MYRRTEWPSVIAEKPNAARSELVKAFRAAGSVVGAVKLLGISRNAFYSYMNKLNITYEYLVHEAYKHNR